MSISISDSAPVLRPQVIALNRVADFRAGITSLLDTHDDRGDVTPRTVGIAVMTAVAVIVGGLITAKITAKESTISLD